MNKEFYLVPIEIIDRLRATESSFQRGVIVDELLKLELEITDQEGWEHVEGDHSGTSEDKGLIDWSKAPPGTTHCFSHRSEKQKNPPEDELYMWEKWDNSIIFEWNDEEDFWQHYMEVNNLDDDDKANRVRRPV